MLTNRDLATLIWLGVLLLVLVYRSDGRSILRGLAGAFLPITVLLAVFVIYVLGLVIAGQRLGWWNPDLAKDSVIWFLTVGFPTWFNVQGASEDGFFRRTALRTIGIGAVVGFYLNLTAFSLPVELGLQLLLLIAIFMSVMGKRDPKMKPAKQLGDFLILVIVLALAFNTANDLATNWASLDKTQTLLSFALPVWLTLGVLPFIFLFGLFCNYEVAATRVRLCAKAQRVPWKAKLAMVLGFRLSNHDLRSFGGGTADWQLARAESLGEARRIVAEYRKSLREAKAENEAEQ